MVDKRLSAKRRCRASLNGPISVQEARVKGWKAELVILSEKVEKAVAQKKQDQPKEEPRLMDRFLSAFWGGGGQIKMK